MALATPELRVYKSKNDKMWRVRYVGRNGEKWLSTQKYTTKSSAINSARRLMQTMSSATIVVVNNPNSKN